jgi:hypothetical protein
MHAGYYHLSMRLQTRRLILLQVFRAKELSLGSVIHRVSNTSV